VSSVIDRRDVVELFDVLVAQPLRQVQRPAVSLQCPDTIQPPSSGSAGRRLVVLDGLDECCHGDRDQLLAVVEKFDATTPDWLYLVVFCCVVYVPICLEHQNAAMKH